MSAVKRNAKRLLRAGLLIVCAGFIFIGINRGEVMEVFIKAVNVCLECIGLG